MDVKDGKMMKNIFKVGYNNDGAGDDISTYGSPWNITKG